MKNNRVTGSFDFKKWMGILFLILIGINGTAQNASTQIQVRAAWLTTLNNIDWPSKPGLNEQELKNELTTILNFYMRTGINTVFFQVRPTAEVFYQSSMEPWSRYITGTKGQTPPGNFDPLQYLLEEGHKRGMEIHAWINPFRTLFSPTKAELNEFLQYQEFPEWYIKYGNHLYVDPGNPAARNYVVDVVKDLVDNYDVDGIHFDDYFYPYPKNRKLFNDSRSFKLYADTLDLATWRRANIDDFILNIHQYLTSKHPYIKFGISPFGVWENASAHPDGSETQASITSYSTNYANVPYWMEQGWIDYLIPQLYWNIGFELADFATLTEWWNRHTYGRQLYVGHSNYKLDAKSTIPDWRNGGEIVRQFRNIEQYPNIMGSAFFNTSTLIKNPLHSTDSITQYFNAHPARIPQMAYKPQLEPSPLQQLKCREQNEHLVLYWKLNKNDDANFNYAIYVKSKDAMQLKMVIPGHLNAVKVPTEWFAEGKEYNIYVGALSRTHKENRFEKSIRVEWKRGKIQCKTEKE